MASFFIGGRQEVSLLTYLFKFRLMLDIWPARYTLDNVIMRDLLATQNRMCWSFHSFFDVTRFLVYVQLDYLDCKLGVLGILFTSNTNKKCQWQNNYVNKPIIDWSIFGDSS